MTFAELKQIIEENKIPEDVALMSDSGWECDATDINKVFYCEEANAIIFTSEYDSEEDVATHGHNQDIGKYWKLLRAWKGPKGIGVNLSAMKQDFNDLSKDVDSLTTKFENSRNKFNSFVDKITEKVTNNMKEFVDSRIQREKSVADMYKEKYDFTHEQYVKVMEELRKIEDKLEMTEGEE